MNQLTLFNNLSHQLALWQSISSGTAVGLTGCAINQAQLESFKASKREMIVHYCPSSAARHAINIPPPWHSMSLPQMFEQFAGNSRVRITLQSDHDLARLDAMDALLAALALDLPTELWIEESAFPGLLADQPKVGTKAFASLPMFGLPHAFTSSTNPPAGLTIACKATSPNAQELSQAARSALDKQGFALDWIF